MKGWVSAWASVSILLAKRAKADAEESRTKLSLALCRIEPKFVLAALVPGAKWGAIQSKTMSDLIQIFIVGAPDACCSARDFVHDAL